MRETCSHEGRVRFGADSVIAWNPPPYPKGGGARRDSASTAPTNNPRVAARYQQCAYRPTVPVSSSVLSPARSVERPNQSVSDRELARAKTIVTIIPCQYERSFI